MTSSNGTIFRVTGHLCGDFTDHRWIPAQRPGTRSFDAFFDLRLNKRLSKQSWGWWFQTPSRPLWRHSNGPTWMSSRWLQMCRRVDASNYHDINSWIILRVICTASSFCSVCSPAQIASNDRSIPQLLKSCHKRHDWSAEAICYLDSLNISRYCMFLATT